MRSYRQMVDDGDWPPTNRGAALFLVGFILGTFFGAMLCTVIKEILG